ncbi:phytanoyl-CoA dioxygenase family protein [Amycolatopsis cynarae]|uniref:Phytanoyl-CoA dioxygenase family protein n=1 Tax=Amycolatopsis cynarae TaxID=2995223 RepID=A0ABY7BBI0_9PSEU|nr:phytanoyl-CoA dioxygenase family protein [Amycolatopsis sp. HUAS 11-8]WAL68221.1 phytanoyl-CoA dioxygenase family protein [Amycolatopsis sp. HUAS 11-8]
MPITPAAEAAVFGPVIDQATLDALELCYRENGFVVLRGVFTAELMDRMEAECVAAQQKVLAGELPERYGSTVFLDDASKAERFVNYVEYVNEISPAVHEAATHPVLTTVLRRLLGEQAWLRDRYNHGIVYQDARPGRESGYTRIGWHSDWQSGPSLDIWPSTAFTFHIDGTSPANGFLRVVPGSHNWATPAPYRNVNDVEVPADAKPVGGHGDAAPPFEMPLRFEAVPGEIPVCTERGDIILHDCYLWHSAARATEENTTRRHVRGGYYGGDRTAERVEQFIKNAAR